MFLRNSRVVQKLLEKDAGARYQSARELQVDLTNLQRDLEMGALLPAAVLGKRSVAVLPFKLLTPNPEDEYLGVALADAVINQVGGGGEVLVRPINTVRRYAKQTIDPLLAAREPFASAASVSGIPSYTVVWSSLCRR